MSLTFECIRTVLTTLPAHDATVRLAIGKAKEFIAADDDPNLRYLGLLALELSLGDADTNIRQEALHLNMGMVNENNVMDIAGMLIGHVAESDPEFANDILGAVLAACGHNVYEMVVDFDWYVSLLADMARTLHCAQGDEIGRQLVNVGLRVQDARPELVRSSRTLLIDPALHGNHFLFPILSAAAWVSGEYVDLTKDPVELVEALLQPRIGLLPISVRAVYIHAVFKVITWCFSVYVGRLGDSGMAMDVTFDRLAADQTVSLDSNVALGFVGEQDIGASTVRKDPFSHESILYMINLIQTTVGPLINCNEVKVQDRAHNLIGFVHLVREIQELNKTKVAHGDKPKLGLVSVNAQMKVAPPDGLVLNENLVELAGMMSEDDSTPSTSIFFYPCSRHYVDTRDEPAVSICLSSLSEHRKRHGLFYLQTGKTEDEPNDYPQANDSLPSSSNNSVNDDKLKTAELVFGRKKSTTTKSRPKVVKLDTEDFLSSMTTRAAPSQPGIEGYDHGIKKL
ncbi:hypothetical protein BDA96_10G242700 [Sorghum bicolor]|uniref:Clathrin/coatomer adaptor adaptin-like N-terminal domain-containing protein n=2 Tax=Sorghum bicolor TaxID=4558 RepID=A0A921U1S0_SORBI|nr:hypothetical protein SORBI_3010G184900 [Sorghum bicolor]KAG0515019.1 hypothetical protein BDA96_10G242700 [Sorghum bicolor]